MLDDKYWTVGWAVGKQGLAVSAAKSVFLVSALRATSDLMMILVIIRIVFMLLYLFNICLFVICPILLTKTTVTISAVPGGANIQLPIQKAASTTTAVRRHCTDWYEI